MPSLYSVEIQKLKGIGEQKAELFLKLGVRSIGDIIRFYPRSYEDWSNPQLIIAAPRNENCCIKATTNFSAHENRMAGGKLLYKITVYDESSALTLVFFNNKYIDRMLKKNTEYFFYGKIVNTVGGLQMISPRFLPVDKNAGLQPIYNLTTGLSNLTVSKAVKQAIEMLPEKMRDPIPSELLQKYGLCSLKYALTNIHFPADVKALSAAQKRLVCEEMLVLNLGMRKLKEHSRSETAISIKEDYSKQFEKLLPFSLTNAQKRAIVDCTSDMMNKKSPMNRLVQGDVGSGKTAVAASICYTCVKNGMQAAFMAPTEVLARQHYDSLSKLFDGSGIKISLLTGSLTKKEKNAVRENLSSGETDIVIGTHALLTDDTDFKNLGLVITDEQHRFGVGQRAKLLSKGKNPHLLVMSATPIPRTLALIIYGDLDVSVIDELPPGRQKIKTVLINGNSRKKAFNFIKAQIQNGRQCYIVCPLIDEGELDLASAENYGAELMLKEFADYPVAILHGKLKPKKKDDIMQRFKNNEISILVSTTVVEVGVDVPNATIMLIENAERFGLSQLHQLRGRVGRGEHKSFCILVSDNKSSETKARLEIMCSTNNGFVIADADLKLRGPGDFFGKRQHGLPHLTIADLSDMDNLNLSQNLAQDIIKMSPDLSDDRLRGLNSQIRLLFGNIGEFGLN